MIHVWLMGASVEGKAVGGYYVPELDLMRLTTCKGCSSLPATMILGEASAVLEVVEELNDYPITIHVMPEPKPLGLLDPLTFMRGYSLTKIAYAVKMVKLLKEGKVIFDVTYKEYPQFYDLYCYFKSHIQEVI